MKAKRLQQGPGVKKAIVTCIFEGFALIVFINYNFIIRFTLKCLDFILNILVGDRDRDTIEMYSCLLF